MSTAVLTRHRRPDQFGLDDWVAAPPFRAWLRQLASDTGLGWRVLARAAGVSSATVYGLLRGLDGRPVSALRRADAIRLLRLDLRAVLDLAKEPADSAVLRSLAWCLGLQGRNIAQIAAHTDLDHSSVRLLMSGGNIWCSKLQVVRAEAACEALGVDPQSLPMPSDAAQVG